MRRYSVNTSEIPVIQEKFEKRLGPEWRDLRIYETIILSTRLISFDGPLITALACFGDISCNDFLLPEGPIGIRMEDVLAITSFSSVSIELSTLDTNPPDAKKTYQWTGVQCEKKRSRKRQGEEWNPFLKRQYGTNWFRKFTLHQEETEDENDVYCNSSSIFLEPCSPNRFTRQLGHLQSVPVPFYQTIDQPWHSGKEVSVSVLKHSEQEYLTRKSAISQVKRIHYSPSSNAAFVLKFGIVPGRFLGKRAGVQSQRSLRGSILVDVVNERGTARVVPPD
ncbi:unnamed protein product [Dovyalis caffra]|uniref:Uncharacterized protein n=1 Tax=Dovyalis caffra TaxID=77055 RepID=A0AAV1RVB0_9ROSI|nr:unnamed protein product [Dovyalis caffra]